MKHRLWLVSLIFIILILGGCLNDITDTEVSGSQKTLSVSSAPTIETGVLYSGAQNDADENKNIDLYYDVSMSMRGYILPDYSRFAKVMEGLYTTAQTIANKEGNLKIKTYQFGDTLRDLKEMSKLKSLDGYKDLTSNIDLVINHANLDNLSVIVTDMDIEEESLDTLINKIGSDYIARGYTIGIVGIKSEYTGYVYDLEEENDRIVLLTDDKEPEDTYPFYLLILGNQADITEFYESLQTFVLSDFPEGTTNFTLIPLASEGIVANVDDQNVSFDYLNDVSHIFVEDQLINNCDEKQYKLTREPKSEIGFKLSGLSFENLPYIPKVVEHLYNNIKVMSYDLDSGDWIEDGNGGKIVTANDQSTGDGLNVEMLINPENMEKDKVYAVQVSTYLKQGEEGETSIFEVPQWVTDWTTDKSKITSWKKEYNKYFKVYGKTASDKVASKYRNWLKSEKIKTCVNLSTTADLDKFFKKITYYVEKSEDIEVYSYVFYVQRKY